MTASVAPAAIAVAAAAVMLSCGGLVRAAVAAEPASVPVMLERTGDLDPCAAGRVAHLKPVPGNTLSVRAGPGTGFAEIDRLALGREVLLCDARGQWHGIIYGPNGTDCAIPASMPAAQPYRGPCRSGWVFGQFIEVTAG